MYLFQEQRDFSHFEIYLYDFLIASRPLGCKLHEDRTLYVLLTTMASPAPDTKQVFKYLLG